MAFDNVKDMNSIDVMKQVCADAGLEYSDDGNLVPGEIKGGFKFANCTYEEILNEMIKCTGVNS